MTDLFSLTTSSGPTSSEIGESDFLFLLFSTSCETLATFLILAEGCLEDLEFSLSESELRFIDTLLLLDSLTGSSSFLAFFDCLLFIEAAARLLSFSCREERIPLIS